LDSDGGFTGTITMAALTGSRTYTFPDATGTLLVDSGGGSLTITNLNLTDAVNQVVLDSDGTFTGTLTMVGLSANRTYTFPDEDVVFGGGGVEAAGTPLLNEVAVWNDATTIRGEPEVTYNGSVFEVTGTNLLQAAGLRLTNSINQIRLDHGGSNVGTISMASLSANRTWTFPNSSITVGNVNSTGSPSNSQVAVWTNSNTIEGQNDLLWTGSVFAVGAGGSGAIHLTADTNQIVLNSDDPNDGTITLSGSMTSARFYTFPDITGDVLISGGAGTLTSINLTAATNQIVLDSDGTFTGTVTMASLGASRVYTFPDASITVGNVSNTGTPVDNQLAVWTSATVVEGDANLTWDATTLSVLNVTITNDLNLSGGVAHGIEFDNGTAGAADTIDWNAGNTQRSTLDENVTYTFTDPPGPARLVLRIIQDVSGTNTVTWPASVEWEGGTPPTISAGGDAIDVISFYHDGTTYYGSFLQNFS
jgi:hypothetical protein